MKIPGSKERLLHTVESLFCEHSFSGLFEERVIKAEISSSSKAKPQNGERNENYANIGNGKTSNDRIGFSDGY